MTCKSLCVYQDMDKLAIYHNILQAFVVFTFPVYTLSLCSLLHDVYFHRQVPYIPVYSNSGKKLHFRERKAIMYVLAAHILFICIHCLRISGLTLSLEIDIVNFVLGCSVGFPLR